MKLVLRFYVVFSFLLFAINSTAQVNDTSKWLLDIEEAKQEAEDKNQMILMSFSGSDWCIPCIRLERDLFATSEFIEFANENLVLLKLDFPAKKANRLSEEQLRHNEQLAAKYNLKGAFPLVVIINRVGEVQGYMQHPTSSVEKYLKSLRKIISE